MGEAAKRGSSKILDTLVPRLLLKLRRERRYVAGMLCMLRERQRVLVADCDAVDRCGDGHMSGWTAEDIAAIEGEIQTLARREERFDDRARLLAGEVADAKDERYLDEAPETVT